MEQTTETICNKFQNDLNAGAIGERIAWDILINEEDTRSVMDVRKDKRFQQYDVDFLWEKSDRHIWWVEIKTDKAMNRTGNIVYETKTSGNIGCFAKTQAEIIMYYDYVGHIMYAIYVPRLRRYVDQFCIEEIRMGDNAQGYLIKVTDLINKKVIIKQWKVAE